MKAIRTAACTTPTPMQPLSHHEILALIAPFAEQGWQADLVASRRLERSLAFKEREIEGPGKGQGLRESLCLQSPDTEHFQLTRVATSSTGLQARLEAQGASPAELVGRLLAVPAAQQFLSGPGYAIALSHRAEAVAASGGATGSARVLLTDAVSRLAGLEVRFRLPRLDAMPADIELQAPDGDVADLPDDLLAVQGARWTRLQRGRGGWVGGVRLRGRGEARSRDAQERLVELSRHLALTLQSPPADYHRHHGAARWAVSARRAVPLGVCVAVILGALAVPSLQLGPDSIFKMLIFNSPPILLVLFFSFRETPRIEIPPWPRPLRLPSWRAPLGGPDRAARSEAA
jgi:hypothetical protein